VRGPTNWDDLVSFWKEKGPERTKQAIISPKEVDNKRHENNKVNKINITDELTSKGDTLTDSSAAEIVNGGNYSPSKREKHVANRKSFSYEIPNYPGYSNDGSETKKKEKRAKDKSSKSDTRKKDGSHHHNKRKSDSVKKGLSEVGSFEKILDENSNTNSSRQQKVPPKLILSLISN
jgi:hypothetical protein